MKDETEMTDDGAPRIGDSTDPRADDHGGGATPATGTTTRHGGAEPADAGPSDTQPQVREAVLVGMAIGLGVAALAGTAALAVRGAGGAAAWWALGTLTVGLGLAAAIRQHRPATLAGWAVVLVSVAVLILGVRGMIITPDPTSVEHSTSRETTFLTDVDEALLGTGAPSRGRVFATLACLAAAVAIGVAGRRRGGGAEITGRTPAAAGTAPRLPRRWVAVGLLGAALTSAVGWAAAEPLQAWTVGRVADQGAQLEVFDPPRLDPELVADTDAGWSRRGIERALPAGDVIVGLQVREVTDADEDADTAVTAVVGLRAEDGAELWRYAVAGHAGQEWINVVAVDPEAGAVLVVVRNAVIGLDLDGGIRYTRALRPEEPIAQWTLVTGSPDHAPPSNMAPARVAVLAAVVGPLFHEVAGVDVATGEVLWREDVPRLCRVATVNPPAPAAVPSTLPSHTAIVYLTATRGDCSTVVRYDGGAERWRTALPPPGDMDFAEASSPMRTPWVLAAPTADQVLVDLQWFGRRDGESASDRQLVAVNADGDVTATISRISDSPPGLFDGPAVAVAGDGGEPLAAVPIRVVGGPDGEDSQSEWVLLAPDLSVAATVPVAEPTEAVAYGAVGSFIFEYRYQDGQIVLRERTAELPVVDRIALSEQERCADGTVHLEGDDRTLLVSCRQPGRANVFAHRIADG